MARNQTNGRAKDRRSIRAVDVGALLLGPRAARMDAGTIYMGALIDLNTDPLRLLTSN